MLFLVENSFMQSRVFQSPLILLLQAIATVFLGKMAVIFLKLFP